MLLFSASVNRLGHKRIPANLRKIFGVRAMPDDIRKPSAWNKAKLPSRHITVGPARAVSPTI
jgi:hypothetical protein